MPVRYWMPNVSFLLPPCFPTLVIVGPALARNCPEFNVEIQKEKRIFQKTKKLALNLKVPSGISKCYPLIIFQPKSRILLQGCFKITLETEEFKKFTFNNCGSWRTITSSTL